MKHYFDHEKLAAYQLSIELVAWVADLLETLPKALAVHNLLDRASTSIPLNIAEGNGKFTSPDRCRYFDNARGSALEYAAALDVLVAKKKVTVAQVETGKESLHRIVSMLVGLIRSNSSERLHEEVVEYRAESKEEK